MKILLWVVIACFVVTFCIAVNTVGHAWNAETMRISKAEGISYAAAQARRLGARTPEETQAFFEKKIQYLNNLKRDLTQPR